MLRFAYVTVLALLLAGCSSSPKPATGSNVNPPPVEYAR